MDKTFRLSVAFCVNSFPDYTYVLLLIDSFRQHWKIHKQIYTYMYDRTYLCLAKILFYPSLLSVIIRKSMCRRNYVPFLSTLPEVRYESCFLRKLWGKCYVRCIVKFYFLTFIEWISNFYYVFFCKDLK